MIFSIKRKIRLIQRYLNDWKKGNFQHLRLERTAQIEAAFSIELKQPIMPSEYFENKLHNIQVCANKINGLLLQPNQIFSFWYLIGSPTLSNGFQKGRMLKQGKLHAEVGGGICQASSILYHLSLISGLKIVERHCHSVDIYEEHERFTPLGSDATVVHGFKDLRFQNPFNFPIYINIEINENQLICRFFSASPIQSKKLSFDKTNTENQIIVKTNELKSNNQSECIAVSFYNKKR